MRMAVIAAKVVLEQKKGTGLGILSLRLPSSAPCAGADPARTQTGGTFLCTQTGHQRWSRTIRCLYSSEASCTAVSQALGLVEYTLLGSSFQYLEG